MFLKAKKPTKPKRTDPQPDTKISIASVVTPIAGAALGTRIPMEGTRIGIKAPTARTSPVLAAAQQATMQVARNTISSQLPAAANKSQLNPNLMKQFEAYDRSHFQAQRVRQQSRMPAVRPSGPRTSVTQIVQNIPTYNPLQSVPAPKSKVDFGQTRLNK
jgi:hypothetical protein